jgi:hypothetical protein
LMGDPDDEPVGGGLVESASGYEKVIMEEGEEPKPHTGLWAKPCLH